MRAYRAASTRVKALGEPDDEALTCSSTLRCKQHERS
jgi:hypothetical protein